MFRVLLLSTALLLAHSNVSRAASWETLVSWYGKEFDGKKMANGDTFSKRNVSLVAHPTLPLGTVVYISNPSTEKSIVAEVTDRGPACNRKIRKKPKAKNCAEIDVSEAGAKALGFKNKGKAHLRITILFFPHEDREG